jgi:hypothetical protein
MSFVCNITGQSFDLDDSEKDRELANRFGYNSRFRAICYVFCKLFYGECKIFDTLEENKTLKGIGITDSGWTNMFEQKFDYTNTICNTSSNLNIYDDTVIKKYNELDFIISSETFNHIEPYPSLQKAFNNLFKMLKCGGSIVFSVPYSLNEHIEYFPNLYKYKIVNKKGKQLLHNKTKNNKTEVFDNLCFDGGDGNGFVMRIFSKKSITSFLETAGFVDITFYSIDDDMKKYGIFWREGGSENCGLIISAKRPN